MDSSSGQHHHQEMSPQTLESMLVCTKSQQEKKARPADMQAIKCPRCDSTNTKFCYYNNYSLTQPRYFCKSCRRYWTKGGTLRNVPVGGGCRKTKRSSSKRSQDQPITTIPSPIPSLLPTPLSYDSNDLSLAIARLQKQSNSGQVLGLDDHDHFSIWGNNPNIPGHHADDHVLGGLGGFLDNPSSGGIHNMYYGMGNVNLEVENIEMGLSGAQEMGIPFQDFSGGTTDAASTAAATTVKQEIRNGGSRVLWGFPWQSISGDGNGTSWNGINGSANWHGFLNSPLM